jgi:hypothetical protein
MPMLGIRAYARHRQVSHVAVLKALKSGRIHANPEGLVDAEAADRAWARNTHPAPRAPRAIPSVATEDGGYSAARTVRAVYEARLARLEYERRAAALLPADEVRTASHRIGEIFRQRMFQVPDAVVARLQAYVREHGAVPDEPAVHQILTAEIRAALIAFCNSMAGPT